MHIIGEIERALKEFDANNELLKGKREIKVNYAPTPLTVVQGEPNNSAWVIPRLCSNETEEQVQFLPIKAKTRFLFFNGSKVTHPTQPIVCFFVTRIQKNILPVILLDITGNTGMILNHGISKFCFVLGFLDFVLDSSSEAGSSV